MELDQLTDENGIITRAVQIRAAGDAERREFTGIGVPWNDPVEIRSWFGSSHIEMFERGSVELGESGAHVFWRHGEVIGRVAAGRDADAGYEIDGIISDTTLGRDAYAMLRDGTINRLSIGFQPLEWRETEDGTIVYTKVRAVEFSLVPQPAYDNAKVSAVRAAQRPTKPKGTKMDPDTETLTRADLAPINSALDELTRGLALVGHRDTAMEGAQFRSMGDFLKALVAGDESAAEFHRAYTGATTDDTVMKDSFVGDFIRLVSERRRIMNQFQKGTLPKDGLSVDYYQLDTDSTQVGKQAAQGDDLLYGKITLKSANAPVDTIGGWTELSRQAIERATVPALNTTLRALALKYSRYTNNAVATVYRNQINAKLAAFNDATTPDASAAIQLPGTRTATDWLNAIIDAALRFEERGYAIGGLNVSADVFKELNGLKDGDQRLMRVYGDGVNQVGELNLSQVSGNLAGVTATLLPNTTGSVASFFDPIAIETLESSGAPAQLQDENIINLTKQFSLYGYQAIIVPFSDAILPLDFA